MLAAARIDNIQAYIDADRDFHQGLLRASHNWLIGHMSAVVATTFSAADAGRADMAAATRPRTTRRVIIRIAMTPVLA